MNIEDAARFVDKTKPSLLYITGKTSTGKTTFATGLVKKHDYRPIVLDQIVREAVILPFDLQSREGDVFVSVYRTADKPEWVAAFVAETRKRIMEAIAQKAHVLVEGAVANPDIVNQILAGVPGAEILYFHPKKADSVYLRNLRSRFKDTTVSNRNGLPNGFWKHIDTEDFAQFCTDHIITPALEASIADYCEESKRESSERLATFKQHLSSLRVIEI